MVRASSRVGNAHPRRENGRDIFSPAPISEMITISSVAFSMMTGVSVGWGE